MKRHFDYDEPFGGKTLCGIPVTHMVETVSDWSDVNPDDPTQCKRCIRSMDAEMQGMEDY